MTYDDLVKRTATALNVKYPNVQTDNDGQIIVYTGLREVLGQDELVDFESTQ